MSTKTLRKRIALVAVSAMGFGLMSTVVAPSASAATITGSVSPVRMSYTTVAGTTTLDAVPASALTWTQSAALVGTDTARVTLTSAPTPEAILAIYLAAAAACGALASRGRAGSKPARARERRVGE